MANDDHVLQLRQGVDTWNEWRREHPDADPDLRDAALRGLNLTGADLVGADLRHADLRGTILRGARLLRARLDGANLFKTVLDDADLECAVLSGVQFVNCAQLIVAQNWQSARRDPALQCGAPLPSA